jgi:hypothetical protein
MSVAMVGRMRNDFVFDVQCVMRERGSVFLLICSQCFGKKGAQTVNLENTWGIAFLHEYRKLEGQSWHNALSSISSVHCAS